MIVNSDAKKERWRGRDKCLLGRISAINELEK